MDLLFTRQELDEIFKPSTPANSRRAPQPAISPRRLQPSPPKGRRTNATKPPRFCTQAARRMRRSPPDRQQRPTPPTTLIPVRKITLSATTTAHCEVVLHKDQQGDRPTWKIIPIDVPNFRKRADIVARYYHAKNAQCFEQYIPNIVGPGQHEYDDSENAMSHSHLYAHFL
ncbi:hypothetical protein GE061_001664 [Apolygus lucorum]|uniref:Uncharacterized protein n=1 Tax=Apolygus lucorum TaxID=248454 RepID=A0A8S9Y7R9_APOLU|nr:hypothetical protein GE061_001664 [Apolygus lucorum]